MRVLPEGARPLAGRDIGLDLTGDGFVRPCEVGGVHVPVSSVSHMLQASTHASLTARRTSERRSTSLTAPIVVERIRESFGVASPGARLTLWKMPALLA